MKNIFSSISLLSFLGAKKAQALDAFNTAVIDPTGAVGGLTVPVAMNNIIGVMEITIYPVCGAVFAVGALYYVSSAGNDERRNQGKEFMIGSVIGIAIVAGARAILNLTLFFIYA